MNHLRFVRIALFVIFIMFILALVTMCPKQADSDQIITKELALCEVTPLKNFGLCRDFTVGSEWKKGFAGNLPAGSKTFHIETLDNCDSDGWMIFRSVGNEIILWEFEPPADWLESQPKNLILPSSVDETAKSFLVSLFHFQGRSITKVDDWLRVMSTSEIGGIAIFDYCTSIKGFSSEVKLWISPVLRQSGKIVYEIVKIEIQYLNY